MSRCLKLEEDVRKNLGPIDLTAPSDVPLNDYQFRYSRDYACFQDYHHLLGVFGIGSNLRRVVLNEYIAETYQHPRDPSAKPQIDIRSMLYALTSLPKTLECVCIMDLSRKQESQGSRFVPFEPRGNPEPLTQDELENIIRQMKIACSDKWRWGLHYNVPEVTVWSYSNIPIYGPNGPSAYPTRKITYTSS